MFIQKKVIVKIDKIANKKKENSKTWSEEAIDTLINCFQSHECIWNVTMVIIKTKTESHCVKKNFICQCKNITIDMAKKKMEFSDANSYYFHKNAPP